MKISRNPCSFQANMGASTYVDELYSTPLNIVIYLHFYEINDSVLVDDIP